MKKSKFNDLVDEKVKYLLNCFEKYEFDHSEDERKLNFFVQRLSLDCVAELTKRAVDLGPFNSSYNTINHISASLFARYVFEIYANISVILNHEDESERSRLKRVWVSSRELVPSVDSYGIPFHLASERTIKGARKHHKKYDKLYHRYRTEKESGKNIDPMLHFDLKDSAVLLHDPFEIPMSKKSEYFKYIDKELFLAHWKIYSHISHGSSLSLMPRWPVCFPDADCLAVFAALISTYADSVRLEHSHKDWANEIFDVYESLKVTQ